MNNSVAKQRASRLPEPARTAGVALLLVLLTGGFAQIYVFMRLPTDDAATTARNILAHETVFRLGIACALLSALCVLVEVWALYLLLRLFRESVALLALLLHFTGLLIFAGTMHDNFLALDLLRSASSLSPLSPSQLQSVAQLLLAHDYGLRTSLIFSSAGGIVFAWLFFKSHSIPRFLSGYSIFANAFVLISCFSLSIAPTTDRFLFPWFALANFLAMLSLGLWLSIRGAIVEPGKTEANLGVAI